MAVRVQVPLRVRVVPCKTLTYRAFYFIWYKRTTLPLLLGVSPKTRLYSFSRFQYYAHNLDSLNKKNGMSATPLN